MSVEVCKCRICGNKKMKKILDLGFQELTGVFPKPGEKVEGGMLQLVKCYGENSCGLVQLRHSFSGEMMYGNNYGYRSGLNESMVQHLASVVNKIENRLKFRDGDMVLDIGSNDGTLLSKYSNRKLDFIGMDPTGSKFRKYYPSDVELYADFFSASNVKKLRGDLKAKAVTSIAMFYDLEDPIQFAQDVCSILDDEGVWVLEQSYLPSMIRTISYDTVCHEHLEFYCLKQIDYIMRHSGLKIIDVEQNDINGGSFQLTVAKDGSKYAVDSKVNDLLEWEEVNGYNGFEIYDRFEKQVIKNKNDVRQFLNRAKQEGKLVLGYGASTKGNVMLQFCGITGDDIKAIADVNEDKYGCVTPGTHIPIISEEDARKMKPDYFLVLPWHFREFILKKEMNYMKESGCKFCFAFPKMEIVSCEEIN